MFEILSNTSWQEWFAVIFSTVQVLLAYKNHPLTYLFGIAGILLAIYVLFTTKLYAEVSVNVYYLVMSIYGWYIWTTKRNKSIPKIDWADKKHYTISTLILFGSFAIIYPIIRFFTDTDVAFWDSLVAAFAYSGMYLLAKRKIENWIFLNCSNLIAIPLQIHKEIYLFAVLTIILFIVAVFGFFNWIKIKKKESTFSEIHPNVS